MNMKTSIRNQYHGRQRLSVAVNDEISVSIAGEQEIVAIITHNSTKEMALSIGSEVFAPSAHRPSSSCTMMKRSKLSARNQLTGKISRITKGAINTDISLSPPAARCYRR